MGTSTKGMYGAQKEKNASTKTWNKKLKDYSDIEVLSGVVIDKSIYDVKENRIFTLFIKGLITYCLTMGGAGLYLSGFEV